MNTVGKYTLYLFIILLGITALLMGLFIINDLEQINIGKQRVAEYLTISVFMGIGTALWFIATIWIDYTIRFARFSYKFIERKIGM